jgi:hypothetical protein
MKPQHSHEFELEIDDRVYNALNKAMQALDANPRLKKGLKA